MINASCTHCVHTTFNLISKVIVMARKTDIVHYENTTPSGKPKILTPLKQPAVFQAIIIHYDKSDLHDFKDKNKISIKK